jgi:hypothetical protein
VADFEILKLKGHEGLVQLFFELMNMLGPDKVGDAFLEAFFQFGHASGHNCKGSHKKNNGSGKRSKKPKTSAEFFRQMGIEPPKGI